MSRESNHSNHNSHNGRNSPSQWLAYLDWIEARGQVYPRMAPVNQDRSDAVRPHMLMVHELVQLDDQQEQLARRIAAACGFTGEQAALRSVTPGTDWESGLDTGMLEIVVTFGERAAAECSEWMSRTGIPATIHFRGPGIEALQSSPLAKRDLWQQLQARRKPSSP